jgi:hypothetical protein
MDPIAKWVGIPEIAGENEQLNMFIQMPEENWESGYRLEKITVSDEDGNLIEELTTNVIGVPFVDSEPLQSGGSRYYTCMYHMPASNIVLSASFLEPAHECPCAMFEDMPDYGTTEHDAIDWAYTHEPPLTSGTSATTFGTYNTVTRAQALTFLWIAMGSPEPTSSVNPFTDVKEGKWYTKAVLWAVEKGITSGTSATTFGTNKTCNRGEILTFLYAALDRPGYTIENPYSDVQMGKGYTDAAIWAYENGIEKGEDGLFNRRTNCTRVSTITYIYRAVTGNGLIE